MVNNSNAKGKFQTPLELRGEDDPREQSSHSLWNPDRGSRNQVPRGREFVGDDGDYGDGDGWHFGSVASLKENSNH